MHRVRGIVVLGLAVLCPSRAAYSQSDQSAAGAKSYRLEPTPKTVTGTPAPSSCRRGRELATGLPGPPLARRPGAPYHPA